MIQFLLKASLVVQRVKNLPAMQETQVQSLGWEDPLEEGMETHSSILAWRIPWKRSLVSYRLTLYMHFNICIYACACIYLYWIAAREAIPGWLRQKGKIFLKGFDWFGIFRKLAIFRQAAKKRTLKDLYTSNLLNDAGRCLLGSGGSRTGKRRKPSKGAVSSDGPQGSYSLIPQRNNEAEVTPQYGPNPRSRGWPSQLCTSKSLDKGCYPGGQLRRTFSFRRLLAKANPGVAGDVGVAFRTKAP